MKKLLQWKYLFLTAAALGLAAALATLPLNGNETRAEPAKTPNPWSELPEETPPEPTPEPDWAPTPAADAQAARTGNLYEAVLSVDPRTAGIYGKLRLTYVNTSSDVLYAVKLRLHANDVSSGCLTLETVAVNGERAY